MEKHLEKCIHCRNACDSLKRTLAMCRELPTPEVPSPIAASIRSALQTFLHRRTP
jgi:RNA polymerase sigma-70 factor (ECF subfamily)